MNKLKQIIREEIENSVEDIIKKTKTNMKSQWYKNVFKWVPIDYLFTIKEFNRIKDLSGNHSDYHKEYLNKLGENIKKNGLKEPAVIDYDPHTNTVLLVEGNHRIVIFQYLGIEAIPAIVFLRKQPWDDIQKLKAKDVSGLKNKEKYYDNMWKEWRFPPNLGYNRNVNPGLIGIPTINM